MVGSFFTESVKSQPICSANTRAFKTWGLKMRHLSKLYYLPIISNLVENTPFLHDMRTYCFFLTAWIEAKSVFCSSFCLL